MARGKQLNEQDIYNVMTSYVLTRNYSETAKQLSIPETTVRKTVLENQDKAEYAELCRHKKEEFAENCTEIIHMLLAATRKKAQMYLDDAELLASTKITDITTSMGTLYDKRALSQGESTENVTFKMPDEVKEFVR